MSAVGAGRRRSSVSGPSRIVTSAGERAGNGRLMAASRAGARQPAFRIIRLPRAPDRQCDLDRHVEAPRDHVCVKTTNRRRLLRGQDRGGSGGPKRFELLGLLRPWFVRPQPWLQAGKYLGALVSDLPKRNGWTIAQRAGHPTPGRTHPLLPALAGPPRPPCYPALGP